MNGRNGWTNDGLMMLDGECRDDGWMVDNDGWLDKWMDRHMMDGCINK